MKSLQLTCWGKTSRGISQQFSLSYMHNKMPLIRHQIDSLPHNVFNKVILRSIIDTVIVCGQQGIPLRDHRDDHTIEMITQA